MDFEIGQIWEVPVSDMPEPLQSARPQLIRRGMLTGMTMENGAPIKLFFSCPMIPGRRSGEVHPNEWPENAQLLVPGS